LHIFGLVIGQIWRGGFLPRIKQVFYFCFDLVKVDIADDDQVSVFWDKISVVIEFYIVERDVVYGFLGDVFARRMILP
jgi:hypothetical protein